MVGIYDVFCDERKVGRVEVRQEGLYYSFSCRCAPGDSRIYRLQINCGKGWQSLGIPIPEGDVYVLRTKIQRKQFLDGLLSFRLVSNQQEKQFIPVSEKEPFDAIDRLRKGVMVYQNGIQGILIEESI